eukprot:Skav202258  [mRNA]  locus=scaffold1417:379124:381176:+ [translate_table: standard]
MITKLSPWDISKYPKCWLALSPLRWELLQAFSSQSHLLLEPILRSVLPGSMFCRKRKAEPSPSRNWPSGKAVKLTFREKDGATATQTVTWKPHEESFREVIARAAIPGLEVSWKGADNVIVQEDASESGIRKFLVRNHGRPKPQLQVEWSLPTILGMSHSQAAKAWFLGDGAATDQAVTEAQQNVEKNGGKITGNSGSGPYVIEHKGYSKDAWPQAVEGLKSEFGLSEPEAQALLNAARREEGKCQHFQQTTKGKKTTTAFVAYHTICQDDQIDLIFGKYEASMEVIGAPPRENCIQYNGTNLAVWPPASPHSVEEGTDMRGLVVEIPLGWQLVNSTQEGFDNIRQRVIARYPWHTNVLVTSGPNGQLQGWLTSRHGDAGNQWVRLDSGHVEKRDQSHFHFKATSLRLLIQEKTVATPKLLNHWKQFVKLSAQREWSQQLGVPHGSVQE